jgi:hypothetical protein
MYTGRTARYSQHDMIIACERARRGIDGRGINATLIPTTLRTNAHPPLPVSHKCFLADALTLASNV